MGMVGHTRCSGPEIVEVVGGKQISAKIMLTRKGTNNSDEDDDENNRRVTVRGSKTLIV